jgi:hypothetical protein
VVLFLFKKGFLFRDYAKTVPNGSIWRGLCVLVVQPVARGA